MVSHLQGLSCVARKNFVKYVVSVHFQFFFSYGFGHFKSLGQKVNQIFHRTSEKNEIPIFCTIGAVEDQTRGWIVHVRNTSSAQRNNIVLGRHVASVVVSIQLNAISVDTYIYIQ